MNEHDSNHDDPAEAESPPRNAVQDDRDEHERTGDPPQKDAYDDFNDRMIRIGRGIFRWVTDLKGNLRYVGLSEQANLAVGVIGLSIVFAYTVFAYLQWSELNVGNKATQSTIRAWVGLVGNARNLREPVLNATTPGL